MLDKNIYIEALKKAKPIIITIGILLALFLLMSSFMTGVLLFAATIMAAWGVRIFSLRWSGFELATLTTILFGLSFGPWVGGIMGFITVTSQLLLGAYLNTYILWVIPGYVVAGVIAGSFMGANIATTGLAIAVLMHLSFVVMTAIITPPALIKYLPYAALNLVINYFLFTLLGPVLMQIIT